MSNKESTRAFADNHEKSVCKALGGRQTSGSGANRFEKGDVVIDDASLMIECKCAMTDKQSFSIKKDWLEKNNEEAFRNRLNNKALCFRFGPSSKNYYVIDEKLMRLLVDALKITEGDM